MTQTLPRFTLETTPKGMWAVRDNNEGRRVYITPRKDYAEGWLANCDSARFLAEQGL